MRVDAFCQTMLCVDAFFCQTHTQNASNLSPVCTVYSKPAMVAVQLKMPASFAVSLFSVTYRVVIQPCGKHVGLPLL